MTIKTCSTTVCIYIISPRLPILYVQNSGDGPCTKWTQVGIIGHLPSEPRYFLHSDTWLTNWLVFLIPFVLLQVIQGVEWGEMQLVFILFYVLNGV